MIASGDADEVRASMQGLERDLAPVIGGTSISEPLFQLMCHGVPTRVKAAVDRCAGTCSGLCVDTVWLGWGLGGLCRACGEGCWYTQL